MDNKDMDIVKNPNHKLSLWQYWYKLNKETVTELLEDGAYYLLLHADHKTPVIGLFSRACDGFIVTMVNSQTGPIVLIHTDDPKLTHFTDLLSRDEYLGLIEKCERVLDDWVKTKEENNNE